MKKNKIYFADFETTIDEGKLAIWGLDAYDKEDFTYGINLKSFFDEIIKKDIDIVYLHNLGYDGNFIFKELLLIGFKFVDLSHIKNEKIKQLWKNYDKTDFFDKKTYQYYKDMQIGDYEFTWLSDDNRNFYTLDMKWKGKFIHFRCSLKLLTDSVANLGKALKIDKIGDFNYEDLYVYKSINEIPAEVIEYLYRDIEIVKKTFIEEGNIETLKLTASATSKASFIEFFGRNEFANHFGGYKWDYRAKVSRYHNVISKDEWDWFKHSYQGGYSYYRQDYKNVLLYNFIGCDLDLVSSYPSELRGYVPFGKSYSYKPLLNSNEKCEKIVRIFIHHSYKKNDEYPDIWKKPTGRFNNENNYLSEIENEEKTMWEFELNFLKEYNVIKYEILEERWVKTKIIHRDWIDELGKLKIDASAIGDEVRKNRYKIRLNAHYGRYGKKYKMYSSILEEDGNFVKKINGEYWLIPTNFSDKNVEIEVKKQRWYIDYKTNKFGDYYKIGKDEKIKESNYIKKWTERKNIIKGTNIKINRLNKNVFRYGVNGEWKHTLRLSEMDELEYIPLASFITAKARVNLQKLIYNNYKHWIYSDTDSCYFTVPMKMLNLEGINIHPTKFGSWFGDYEFDKFKVIKSKCYMLQAKKIYDKKSGEYVEIDKTVKKVAGLDDKGKELLNWETFNAGFVIEDKKRKRINTKYGLVLKNTPYTL